MNKHTPGPWEFDGEYVWADAVRGYVADPNTDDMTSGRGLAKLDAPKMINANGYLIAAAPELLEALVAVMKLHCPYTGNPTAEQIVAHWKYEREQGNGSAQTMLDALAAIAKATGQPWPTQSMR